jgi:DNA-binding Xre family transcriptional regulator
MFIVNMDAGKSLRVLMSERQITNYQLAEAIGVSLVTVVVMRKSALISGKNLVKLCGFFEIQAAEFIKKGES